MGNPYYQPNYEEYYVPWHFADDPIPPEYMHRFDQNTRRIARKITPALPLLAVAAPAGFLGLYAYNADREQRKNIAREAAIDAREKKSRVRRIQDISRTEKHRKARAYEREVEFAYRDDSSRKLLEAANRSNDNQQLFGNMVMRGIDEMKALTGRETSSEIISPRRKAARIPGISPIHVDIPDDYFRPKKPPGYDSGPDKKIMKAIHEQGYANVANSELTPDKQKYILNNLSEHILSEKYLPSVYLDLVDESTRKNIKDFPRKESRLTRAQRRRAQNAPPAAPPAPTKQQLLENTKVGAQTELISAMTARSNLKRQLLRENPAITESEITVVLNKAFPPVRFSRELFQRKKK